MEGRGFLSADRLNRASIGRIQRSLFALSLDAPVLAGPGGRRPGGGAAQVLHGGGASANSPNRWFDKTLQVGRTSCVQGVVPGSGAWRGGGTSCAAPHELID